MDMSLFDQPAEDLKAMRGKRDHRNKSMVDNEDMRSLKKSARRDVVRQRHFDIDGDDE